MQLRRSPTHIDTNPTSGHPHMVTKMDIYVTEVRPNEQSTAAPDSPGGAITAVAEPWI
jgi:hypothetical protein